MAAALDERRRVDLKLCRWCLRQLDDHARFCDKCGMDQLYQLASPVRYQYYQHYQYTERPQPPPQMVLQPPQPQQAIFSPPSRPREDVLQWFRQPETQLSPPSRPPQPEPTPPPVTVALQLPRPEAKILASPPPRVQLRPGVPEVKVARPYAEAAPLPGPPSGVHAPLGASVGRPLGVMLLAAYFSILGICAIASASPAFSPVENIRQLFTSVGGVVVPDLTYLWILQGFIAVMAFLLTYGLLKRRKVLRLMLRVLSALAVVGVVMTVAIAAVLAPSTLMQAAGFDIPSIGHVLLPAYGGLAITALIGIALPAAIFWYLGRERVKEYFGIPSRAAAVKTRPPRRMTWSQLK